MPGPGRTGRLGQICEDLVAQHGVSQWWPAEHPFEVMVGAVLVQNTRWANAERAIAKLKEEDCLSPAAVLALPRDQLIGFLQPAGCQSVKAGRLLALAAWVESNGGVAALRRRRTAWLRAGLLTVPGVGFETADAILCYAFQRPQFIADRYARRLLRRLGVFGDTVTCDYENCRRAMQNWLGWSPARWQKLHAAIVRVSQTVCRERPRCAECGLKRLCIKNL